MLFASIDTAASGDTTLVAAVANRKIRVVGYVIMAAGTVNVAFYSASGSGTKLTGAFPLTAQAGVSSGGAPRQLAGPGGHFESNGGEALVLNLSQAIQVSGHLAYELVGV